MKRNIGEGLAAIRVEGQDPQVLAPDQHNRVVKINSRCGGTAGPRRRSAQRASSDAWLIAQQGGQFDTKGDRCEPLPIEDPEHVDERRLRAGMTTLAEYTEELCKLYQKR